MKILIHYTIFIWCAKWSELSKSIKLELCSKDSIYTWTCSNHQCKTFLHYFFLAESNSSWFLFGVAREFTILWKLDSSHWKLYKFNKIKKRYHLLCLRLSVMSAFTDTIYHCQRHGNLTETDFDQKAFQIIVYKARFCSWLKENIGIEKKRRRDKLQKNFHRQITINFNTFSAW